MNDRTVTVFGGTGFLGRRVVRHLRKHGFSVQIASRHPDRGHRLFGLDPQIQSVEANIHDERSVADALAGAFGVVNAVSLYVEHGQETFHCVHVESAERVAAQAHRAGVERFRNRLRRCLTLALYPQAWRRRTGGPGRVCRRHTHPPRSDVRTGRRVSHHPPQAPPPASNLSDVRPRPHEIAAGLCGRCGGGDRKGAATDENACDHIRVRWPSRLLLRGIAQSRCTRSQP